MEYDVEEAMARLRSSGIPDPERLVEMLLNSPTSAEMIAYAEQLEVSG